MLRTALLLLFAWLAASHPTTLHAGEVSYRCDVMAVLSKAGCNLGVCHGNANGKGGFKLSLRGEAPAEDYLALTRISLGRRVNPAKPAASLILRKPLLNVPHEGGRRFEHDSPEHRILETWIAGGLIDDGPAAESEGAAPRLVALDVAPRDRILVEPEREVRLSVTATFADGEQRDVARMAVYETDNPLVTVSPDGLVRREAEGATSGETTVIVRYLDRQVPVRLAFVPDRPGFVWSGPAPVNFIDEHVFARLRDLRIQPSPPVDDALFLRRAFLDLLGLLPTADEARRFVSDTQPDKRGRLIDEILERSEFADRQALLWSDLLRIEEKTLDRKGVQNFHAWIRDSIAHGKPMDRFVREIVSARGSTYLNPPANYYRALRDPIARSETTAQLFLGVRLQCAKCHNHPFDRWTQDDYYNWASVFARVDYKILENQRRDRNDSHEFDGEQLVLMKRSGDVKHPKTGRVAPAKFLGGESAGEQSWTTALDPEGDRLAQLGAWLTARENDRFARAMVNRIWAHIMGRGIVEPVDDFRATNPPSNPELLDALARDFVEHGYDLRHLVRTICSSATYQASSVPNETNAEDERNFSRAATRRLPAEVLLDTLSQTTGVPVEFNGYPRGVRAGEIPGVLAVRLQDQKASRGDQFLRVFGKPPRLTSCDCERSDESTLAQTFQLISGPLLNEMLTSADNRLAGWRVSRSDAELVDELYWTALTRPPSDEERRAAVTLLAASRDRRRTAEDIAWALLNSQEFLLRR